MVEPLHISTGYKPRPLQHKLHCALRRFNVLVAHRRFGKTVFCINHMIDRALSCMQKRPIYVYVAPFRNQAKKVAWPYIKEYTANLPGVKFNEADLVATLHNGATIQLFGADDPDTMRGLYVDGAVLDEYAQINPSLWTDVLQPMMIDRKGWAIFIGTPQGHDAFYDLYQQALQDMTKPGADWFAANYKASETGILDPDELALARKNMLKATGDDDKYMQEFENSFEAAIKGAYYGKQLAMAEQDGRILDRIAPTPQVPVQTAWDIGVGDSTAIWFFRVQPRTGWIDVIDYYENNGCGIDHYVNVLQRKQRELGYTYGIHHAPHDAAVKEWGSGKTRLEQAQSLGIRFRMVPRASVEDGINAARSMLPRCRFDKSKCYTGIEHLRLYKQKWDDNRKTFSNAPEHGPHSHSADAFRYAALGIREDHYDLVPGQDAITTRQPTLDELLSEHDKANREGRSLGKRI